GRRGARHAGLAAATAAAPTAAPASPPPSAAAVVTIADPLARWPLVVERLVDAIRALARLLVRRRAGSGRRRFAAAESRVPVAVAGVGDFLARSRFVLVARRGSAPAAALLQQFAPVAHQLRIEPGGRRAQFEQVERLVEVRTVHEAEHAEALLVVGLQEA